LQSENDGGSDVTVSTHEQSVTTRLRVKSPIGDLVVSGDAGHVTELLLPNVARGVGAPSERRAVRGPVADAAKQLDEYFAGRRRAFDLPLSVSGTPFQEQVWLTLAEIPYGETISYAELARWVGRPQAFRAVGQANGANPIAIILPCHRVIAADGSIGGYGGGLPTKRRLLDLESR
jgi:methylated-DNA-[protein]-cysteine S-methyltransferase